MAINIFHNKRITIIDGEIRCNQCFGIGSYYKTFMGDARSCEKCNGTGRRPPTFTEEIIYKGILK